MNAHQKFTKGKLRQLNARHYLSRTYSFVKWILLQICELNFNFFIKYERNMHNMWLIWDCTEMTLIIPKLIFIWHRTMLLFLCLLLRFAIALIIISEPSLFFVTINFIHFSFVRSSTRVNEFDAFLLELPSSFFLTNNSSGRWNISLFYTIFSY